MELLRTKVSVIFRESGSNSTSHKMKVCKISISVLKIGPILRLEQHDAKVRDTGLSSHRTEPYTF